MYAGGITPGRALTGGATAAGATVVPVAGTGSLPVTGAALLLLAAVGLALIGTGVLLLRAVKARQR